MPDDQVAVVGAGLAGCLLATMLGRRGIPVTVYERRPDPRAAGAESGWSINLALSARGLDALGRIGLREEALRRALPMRGRMLHGLDGQPDFRPYSADGRRAINSIGRADLNHCLLDAAEQTPGVSLCFDHRLTDLDLDEGRLMFATAAGKVDAAAGVVFASDGSSSAARRAIESASNASVSQDFLAHSYKELTIPPHQGDFALDPAALHIWPRGESMMIALPNVDRSFTATLFWPTDDLDALTAPTDIVVAFRTRYPDVVPLMPTLALDYQANPVGSLATVRCWPWVHRGRTATLALVGDAAHAIVPFFGQGANCALEDCVELDRILREAAGDWTVALPHYQQARKANCDTIADLALENFVEMRDTVTSRAFQARIAARHALERRMPSRFISRYELVSFTTVPYAEIPSRMRSQDRFLARCAAGGLALFAAASVLLGRRSRTMRQRTTISGSARK